MTTQAMTPKVVSGYPMTPTTGFIDSATAATILSDDLFERQRRLDKNHARVVREMMLRGEFTQGYQPLIFVLYRGKRYLIDGQHRLTALADCVTPATPGGLSIEFAINNIDLSHLNQAEFNAVAATIFYTLDRGKTRDLNLRLPELAPLVNAKDKRETGAVKAATGVIRLNFNNILRGYCYEAQSGEALTERIGEWADEAVLFLLAIRDPKNTERTHRLLRTSCVAVALTTIRYLPVVAVRFWRELASGMPFSDVDARRRFLDYLQKTAGKTDIATDCRIFAHCWAHYAKGEEMTKEAYIKKDKRLAPIFIYGTDYKVNKGNQVVPETAKTHSARPNLRRLFPRVFANLPLLPPKMPQFCTFETADEKDAYEEAYLTLVDQYLTTVADVLVPEAAEALLAQPPKGLDRTLWIPEAEHTTITAPAGSTLAAELAVVRSMRS